MKFNNMQKVAIAHKDGPMMVLAGPGSGKTTVITKRILTLIEECHVKPEKILVITFSKAASEEMRERFLSLNDAKRCNVWFGTFHAVFFHILRETYHYESKNIITPILQKKYLEEAIGDTKYETFDMTDFAEEVMKEVSKVKGEGVELDYYYSVNCPEEIFRHIYKGYEDRLRKYRLIDFDDMIILTYELFRKHPNILTKWQERFSHILIDEFQDINQLQYEIIKLLAIPENNLFIVGDDDQSIYGFRGAKPGIMLQFPDDFKETKKVTLGTNYRCSKEIMTAASRLINTNEKRYKKELKANRGKIDAVRISKCKDIGSENQFLVDNIKEYCKKGISYNEMAILFRTNNQARSVVGKLMEYNIPFIMREALPNIFEHFIAKDMIAYVKLAMGNRERQYFLQIANHPKRYLSREAFEESVVSFQGLYSYYHDKPWMKQRIDQFQQDLKSLKHLVPYAALDYIRKVIGYDEYLEEYAKYRGVKVEDWIELLNDLQETTKEKETFEHWFTYIEEYTQTLKSEAEEKRHNNVKPTEGVQLLTMHRSKGLEFDVVFMPDVNEGLAPYRKAVQIDDIEEERRMFYVAMTRARKHLHLIYLKERYSKESEPSRFLFEIWNHQKTNYTADF